jgi:branched-chain amino acid transport system substrate-binding protein
MDMVNSAGGLLGRKVEMVKYDDAASPPEALAAVNRAIIKDKAIAILGPYTSSAVLASMKDAAKAKVPMITNAIAQKITEQGNKFIFRVNVTSDIQARALAEYTGKVMGVKKAAFIYPSDDFGMSQKKSFTKYAKQFGVRLVAEESHVPGSTDFYTILTKLKPSDAEVVIIASLIAEGTQIVIQASELRLRQKLLAFGGLSDDKFQKMAGKAAEGVMMLTQFEATHPRNEAAKEYIEAFKKRYGSPPNQFAGQGHAMIAVLFDAIKRAGTDNPVKIRDAIASTSNLPTTLGALSFEPNGQGIIKTMIAIVKDGRRIVHYEP